MSAGDKVPIFLMKKLLSAFRREAHEHTTSKWDEAKDVRPYSKIYKGKPEKLTKKFRSIMGTDDREQLCDGFLHSHVMKFMDNMKESALWDHVCAKKLRKNKVTTVKPKVRRVKPVESKQTTDAVKLKRPTKDAVSARVVATLFAMERPLTRRLHAAPETSDSTLKRWICDAALANTNGAKSATGSTKAKAKKMPSKVASGASKKKKKNKPQIQWKQKVLLSDHGDDDDDDYTNYQAVPIVSVGATSQNKKNPQGKRNNDTQMRAVPPQNKQKRRIQPLLVTKAAPGSVPKPQPNLPRGPGLLIDANKPLAEYELKNAPKNLDTIKVKIPKHARPQDRVWMENLRQYLKGMPEQKAMADTIIKMTNDLNRTLNEHGTVHAVPNASLLIKIAQQLGLKKDDAWSWTEVIINRAYAFSKEIKQDDNFAQLIDKYTQLDKAQQEALARKRRIRKSKKAGAKGKRQVAA